MRKASWVLIAALVALAGCGAVAKAPQTPARKAAAHPGPVRVTLLFDGPYVGFYAPFYAAAAKGYYRRAGLDVRMVPGKGSVTTVEQVGRGHYTFGFADSSAAATAITRGVPVKVVAAYFQKSPLAVVYDEKRPIRTARELIGKTIAEAPGTTTAKVFPAVLAANHIRPDQVKLVSASSLPALVSAVAQGKVDGSLTFGIYAIPLMAAKGVKLGQLLFGDAGVSLLSEGLVVGEPYLKDHPAVVGAFVKASTEGWNFAVKHPAQAIAMENRAVGKQLPGALGMLKLSLPLLRSAATRGHPLGWMAARSWRQTLAVLVRYEGMKKPLPLARYYTDRFTGGA